jgi:hypothetical protein
MVSMTETRYIFFLSVHDSVVQAIACVYDLSLCILNSFIKVKVKVIPQSAINCREERKSIVQLLPNLGAR